VRAFSFGTEPIAAAISPDRTMIVAGAGGGGRTVWRLFDGVPFWSVPNSDVNEELKVVWAAAFSIDNNAVAFGRGGGIIVVESQTNIGLEFENPRGPDGNERGVFDVRFSPDGTLLASANKDNTASLFRMPEGTLLRDLVGHSSPVMSVDFSADGKLLATTAGDGTARLWNMTNNTVVRVIQGGGGTGVPIAVNEGVGRGRFSADGKALLTSSNGTLRFWRVSDGKLLLTYTNVGNGVFAVSPDGKHFAYGTGCSGTFCSIPDTNYVVVLARMPLLITDASVRTNAFQMEWQGGSGTYQVQQQTNVSSGAWQVIAGPFTNTNLSVPMTNRNAFFRVQSIEGPP
jgi:WD40 repeat protein